MYKNVNEHNAFSKAVNDFLISCLISFFSSFLSFLQANQIKALADDIKNINVNPNIHSDPATIRKNLTINVNIIISLL